MAKLLRSNRQIVKANETITTSGLQSGGYLSPEQASKFLQQTFEATVLGGMVRHEKRRAKTGEIDKIGIGTRLLRAKVENTDDGYRATVNHGKLEYATKAVRLPWEITEETLRENIEGQNYEKIVTDLMTRQIGVDLEDLYLNGDEATPAKTNGEDTPDYDFLKLNNGWIKQLKAGAHVVDRSSANSGAMTLDVFYAGIRAIPNKYNNGTLRWLMSPHRRQEWEKYILNQAVTVGGIITDRRVEAPAGIQVVEVPAMPDDCIILTNPKNLITVNTYDMIVRKTTEGKEAVMQDKRFYVCHLDFDCIIEELDAAAIITKLADLT